MPEEQLELIRRVRRFTSVRPDEVLYPLEEFAVFVDAPPGGDGGRVLNAIQELAQVAEFGERVIVELPNGGRRIGATFRVVVPLVGRVVALAAESALRSAPRGMYGVGIVRADYAAIWSALPEILGIAVMHGAMPLTAIPDWLWQWLSDFLAGFGRGLVAGIPDWVWIVGAVVVGGGVLYVVSKVK